MGPYMLYERAQAVTSYDKKLRFIEPMWHSLHAEVHIAEGRGPQGGAEILGVVFCGGTGTNCEACQVNFGAAQVIMRKGVSKGTNTSCFHPLSVSEPSCDTKPSCRSIPCIIA